MSILRSCQMLPTVFLRIASFSLQWSAEMNALITVLGFKWLVGPLETKEVEVEFAGEKQKWKSGVQIKKCRYLEQSGCIGEESDQQLIF